jgi:NADPH:quinone reductase-like Zn-dependent oxidoreductase
MERLGITGIRESTEVKFDRLTRLARLVDQGTLKTHLAKVFPLEMAGEALHYMEKEHTRGKVVLKIK